MISQDDQREVARVVKDTRDITAHGVTVERSTDPTFPALAAITRIANGLADHFEKSAKNFNRAAFLKRCGL